MLLLELRWRAQGETRLTAFLAGHRPKAPALPYQLVDFTDSEERKIIACNTASPAVAQPKIVIARVPRRSTHSPLSINVATLSPAGVTRNVACQLWINTLLF